MACCPSRLVFKCIFLPKNKNQRNIFPYLFSIVRFVFHEVIYWYHHGKFPTARENLFYILLELIEFRNRVRRSKSLPGKIVFPSISFFVDFAECSSTQNPQLSLFAAATINLDALKGAAKTAAEREKLKFNCGYFCYQNPLDILLRWRRSNIEGDRERCNKILKQRKNLIFSPTRKTDLKKTKELQSMQQRSKCHKNILMRYSRE